MTMTTTTAVESAGCPECEAVLPITSTPEVHEILECVDCLVELEVTGVAPLELALAPDVEEDWGE